MNTRPYRPLAIALLILAALFVYHPARADVDKLESPPDNITLFTNLRESGVASDAPFPYLFTPMESGSYRFCAFSEDAPITLELHLPEEENAVRSVQGSGCIYLEYDLSAGQTSILYLICPPEKAEEVTVEVMLQKYGQCLALPITLPSESVEYARSLRGPRDVHFFRFVAPVSGWYTFRTEGVTEKLLDTQGYLLNEQGLTLAVDDDLLFPSDPNFSITARLTADEVYYMRVNAFSNTTGAYRLVVSVPKEDMAKPQQLKVRPQVAVLSVGEEIQLTPELYPLNALPDIAYSSADPDIAVVSSEGVVTAHGAGSTQIVTFASGVRTVTSVIVRSVAVQSIQPEQSRVALRIGEQRALGVLFAPKNASSPTLSWVSETPEIVSVDENGQIAALAVGKGVVVARHGELTARFDIDVLPPLPTYRALVLGEENYLDGRVREGTRNTTQGMTDLLLAQSFDGSSYQVRTQIDSTLDELTHGIRIAFSGAQAKDVSLLYINCHGNSEDDTPYLELHDGTRIRPEQLRALLEDIPGQRVVILDCCQSGSFIGQGLDADGFDALSQGDILVLTSSAAFQDSYRLRFTGGEGEDGIATVLARSLAEGAGWDLIRDKTTKPKADADGDGLVTFAEIYAYTMRRVSYYLSGSGAEQDVQTNDPSSQLVLFSRPMASGVMR